MPEKAEPAFLFGQVAPDVTPGDVIPPICRQCRCLCGEAKMGPLDFDKPAMMVKPDLRKIAKEVLGEKMLFLREDFANSRRSLDVPGFPDPAQLAERFDPAKGSLAGWLLVAARNRAISKLRRKSGKSEELKEDSVSLGVDVESHAAQNLLLDKVRTVMGSLPDGQREALECAYFEGMSHSEIAVKTGLPLGTVKTRIRSAMEALKKVLS